MKIESLSTVLLFCISSITYSQKTNPTQLQSFVGKQIISTVETTTDTRSSTIGINDKNIKTVPTGRKQTTKRLIDFQKEAQQIKAILTIQHIRAAIYGDAGESVYDSDNSFERSGVAAIFGKRFDPFVGKKFVTKYDNEGKNTMPNADNLFDRVWVAGIPKINSNTELSSIFQTSTPPSDWAIEKMWADTLNSVKEVFINTYKVTEIKGNAVQITFKGKSIPLVEGEDKGSFYSGSLEVIKATGFIQKLESERESEVISEAMGTKISSITTTKIVVTNKVK